MINEKWKNRKELTRHNARRWDGQGTNPVRDYSLVEKMSAPTQPRMPSGMRPAFDKHGCIPTECPVLGAKMIFYQAIFPTEKKNPVAEARNEYTYSAAGQKLKVVQKWNPNYSTSPVIGSAINVSLLTQSKTTDYIGNMIYENGALKRVLIDGGYNEGGVYYFYLTDHQGNNRVASDGNMSMQVIHYYPFGTAFAETPVSDQGKQPYKYNGKELDMMSGLNQYDYGARFYDPAIARFTTLDPLCEKYYSISPYAYCGNNPVNAVDETGMDYYMLTSDGRIVLALKTDDNFDRLYNSTTDKNGNTSISEKYTKVNDQGLLPQLAGGKDFATAQTSNSADAFGVFKFAADNSNVEWSLTGYNNKDGMKYDLNTNFDKIGVKRNQSGWNSPDMVFDVHSHSGTKDYAKEASGYDLYFNGLKNGDSDAEFMNTTFNTAKAANKQWPCAYPKLFIYHKETQGLYYYNHKSPSVYVDGATTPLLMRNLINRYKLQPQ